MTVSSTCGKTLAVELRFVDQAGNTLATNYYYPYGGNCAQGDPGALSNLTTKRFTGQYNVPLLALALVHPF